MLYCRPPGEARRGLRAVADWRVRPFLVCLMIGEDETPRWRGLLAPEPIHQDRRSLPRGTLWRTEMKKILLGTVALIALATAPAMAQQSIKIGFISTFSGPVAAIGADMRNAFELGLDHYGRKLGGLPVEVIYEDDQTK